MGSFWGNNWLWIVISFIVAMVSSLWIKILSERKPKIEIKYCATREQNGVKPFLYCEIYNLPYKGLLNRIGVYRREAKVVYVTLSLWDATRNLFRCADVGRNIYSETEGPKFHVNIPGSYDVPVRFDVTLTLPDGDVAFIVKPKSNAIIHLNKGKYLLETQVHYGEGENIKSFYCYFIIDDGKYPVNWERRQMKKKKQECLTKKEFHGLLKKASPPIKRAKKSEKEKS